MVRFQMKVAGETVFFDTHEAPHLDEIAAKWLIEKFGNKEFLDKYAPNRILAVGIGGGPFDEHPTVNGERKEGECAATLVAKALRVDDDPALEKILKFVVTHDLNGGDQPFDLSYLVKLLHQQFPDNPEKVIEWAITGLEAKYQEQLSFFSTTKAEFDRAAEVEEIPRGEQMLRMVTIVSDDNQMSKFVRSALGGQTAILIQKRSSANVQIFTNKRFGLNLTDVAQIIRLEEQYKKGNIVTTDWELLKAEGKVEGVEEWYYHLEGQMLLNGSLTTSDIPPTRLSLEQIKEIVRIGVNFQAFESSRASLCQRGTCTSTRNDHCLWYPWGLHRCRRIRYKMKNPNHFLNSR